MAFCFRPVFEKSGRKRIPSSGNYNILKYEDENRFALAVLLVFCSLSVYAQDLDNDYVSNTVVKNGIGLGSVLAVVTSWTRNRSLRWAFLHAIFGWTYVIYFQITRKPEERRF